jgi:ADP-ribose pyrophosphatase YjhB (NUDIX family)
MSNFSATHPSKIMQYCPKCGARDFLFDGIKHFTCKACNFVYYINAGTAVCGIIELPDNRIILTRRKLNPKAGKLDLPGGFVDTMERAEDALIREIKEELNVDISNLQFLASYPNEYNFKGISYFTCDLAFTIKLVDIPTLKPADDVLDAIFVDPKNIDFETIAFPSIRSILKEYIGRK